MPSKPIRIDIDVINQLQELRTTPGTYLTKADRPSYSATIRKLIRDSLELRRIEQFAMSGNDSTSAVIKFNLSNPKNPQSASKKSYKKSSNTIHLFCFDCQGQTPQRELKTGEWKCSQCGSTRNI